MPQKAFYAVAGHALARRVFWLAVEVLSENGEELEVRMLEKWPGHDIGSVHLVPSKSLDYVLASMLNGVNSKTEEEWELLMAARRANDEAYRLREELRASERRYRKQHDFLIGLWIVIGLFVLGFLVY